MKRAFWLNAAAGCDRVLQGGAVFGCSDTLCFALVGIERICVGLDNRRFHRTCLQVYL
jgi:hypothetical protein